MIRTLAPPLLLALLAACAPASRPPTPPPAPALLAHRLDSIVRAFHRDGRFTGAVLVGRDGRVVYRGAAGMANREWDVANTVDTRFRIASTTKQFTAALVLRLVEDGLLRLDGRVVDYLPDYPRPQGEQVTLHHLLSHSSGIPNYVAVPRFYQEIGPRPHTPAGLVALFAARPLAFAPGARWDYSNSNYVLLGAIVERVTGLPYARALDERLLAPLGLRATTFDDHATLLPRRAAGYVRDSATVYNAVWVDPSTVYAAGMLASTVGDLWTWAEAMRQGRVFRDTATLARATTAHVETGIPLGGYGYGVFVGTQALGGRAVRVIQHGGTIPGFTAGYWRMPDEGAAVIVLSNLMGPGATELTAALAAALY